MIEVFKTNVDQQQHANMLIEQIQLFFSGYRANFDLWDCDRVLRVKTGSEQVQSSLVIALLHQFGFHAEVLPDVLPPVVKPLHKNELPDDTQFNKFIHHQS